MKKEKRRVLQGGTHNNSDNNNDSNNDNNIDNRIRISSRSISNNSSRLGDASLQMEANMVQGSCQPLWNPLMMARGLIQAVISGGRSDSLIAFCAWSVQSRFIYFGVDLPFFVWSSRSLSQCRLVKFSEAVSTVISFKFCWMCRFDCLEHSAGSN